MPETKNINGRTYKKGIDGIWRISTSNTASAAITGINKALVKNKAQNLNYSTSKPKGTYPTISKYGDSSKVSSTESSRIKDKSRIMTNNVMYDVPLQNSKTLHSRLPMYDTRSYDYVQDNGRNAYSTSKVDFLTGKMIIPKVENYSDPNYNINETSKLPSSATISKTNPDGITFRSETDIDKPKVKDKPLVKVNPKFTPGTSSMSNEEIELELNNGKITKPTPESSLPVNTRLSQFAPTVDNNTPIATRPNNSVLERMQGKSATSVTPNPNYKEEVQKDKSGGEKGNKLGMNGVSKTDLAILLASKGSEFLANQKLKDADIPIMKNNDYVELDKNVNINPAINNANNNSREGMNFIKGNSTNSNSINARIGKINNGEISAKNEIYGTAAQQRTGIVNQEKQINNQIKSSNNQIDYENKSNKYNKFVQTDFTNPSAMASDTYDKLNQLSKDGKMAEFQKTQLATYKEANPASVQALDVITNPNFGSDITTQEDLDTYSKHFQGKSPAAKLRLKKIAEQKGLIYNE